MNTACPETQTAEAPVSAPATLFADLPVGAKVTKPRASRKARATDSTFVSDAVAAKAAIGEMFSVAVVPLVLAPKRIAAADLAVQNGDEASLASLYGGPVGGVKCELTWSQLVREQREWQPSERQIVALHIQALREALLFLRSTDVKDVAAAEKRELLQWVFCPDVVNGTPTDLIPFSFSRCCRYYGCNAEELQRMLLDNPVVRALLLKLNLYREEELPPVRRKVYYADIVGEERAAQAVEENIAQFPGMS